MLAAEPAAGLHGRHGTRAGSDNCLTKIGVSDIAGSENPLNTGAGAVGGGFDVAAVVKLQPVLKNLSLTINKNETLAIVGNSGGGKSTLVNLIPRFYDINSGSIRIDGVDIRDFTINSMLYDYLDGRLIDPYGGRLDLDKRILRHTSDRFAEDPLRVLRAMQFSARFDMDVAPETVALCSKIPFENLAPERVFEEWKKLILKGVKISRGLFFLRDCRWIRYFPELAACVNCPQDPHWHPEGDVFVHTAFCMDSFAASRIGDEWEDLIVGLAVLCHDFGKPLCTKLGEDGKIHSYGHDFLGARPTVSFLERMTRQKAVIDEVVPLVERHMAILDLWRNKCGDSAIRRLAGKVKRIDRLVRVDDADRNGRPPCEPGPSPQGEWIMERANALKIKDSAPNPIIKGRHLLAFGLKPSTQFGKIISDMYEAQLDGKFCDEKSAIEYLTTYLKSFGLCENIKS